MNKTLAASALAMMCLASQAHAQSARPDYRIFPAFSEGASATVHFASGSSELSSKHAAALQALASHAKAKGARVAGVLVVGHADRTGEWNSNDLLASDRAVAVGALLAEELGTVKFDIRSRADSEPAEGCGSASKKASTSSCMAANRRAEVTILFAPARPGAR